MGQASRQTVSLCDAACAAPLRAVVQKKSFRASEQDSPEVQAERAFFRSAIKEIPISKLVFLDESGCNLAMARRYGWAPQGLRAIDTRPVNHGANITVVGAIRASGPVVMRSMKGAMNTKRFLQFVRTALAPRLERNDVVVLDNLPAHTAPRVRELVEARGAHVLWLPPYSPDLNPIEFVWSPFKSILNKLAVRCSARLRRAIAGAWRRCAKLVFRGLFRACGYT